MTRQDWFKKVNRTAKLCSTPWNLLDLPDEDIVQFNKKKVGKKDDAKKK